MYVITRTIECEISKGIGGKLSKLRYNIECKDCRIIFESVND